MSTIPFHTLLAGKRRKDCGCSYHLGLLLNICCTACSSGGSSAALSPGAASEAPPSGLIRAVHSFKDVTALHASIEVGLTLLIH